VGVPRTIVRTALGAALIVGLLPVASVNAAGPPKDGALDTAFDGDGEVIHATPPNVFATKAVRQKDGKLVFTGSIYTGANNEAFVARLTTAGALDTTFGGGDGWLSTPITENDGPEGLAVQSDGRILIAGSGPVGGNTTAFLARFTAAGALDTSFSGDGKLTFRPSTPETEFSDMAVQADGKLVASGTSWTATNQMLVARFTAGGAVDTTFNGTGYRTFDGLGTAEEARVVVQPDGKIVIGGYTSAAPGDPTSVELIRLSSTGTPDTSFNGDGTSVVEVQGISELLLAPDGDLVVVGYSDGDATIARVTSGGTTDTGFGIDGRFVGDLGPNSTSATTTAFEPNGRLVVAGTNGLDMFVLRLLPSGVLDPTFGHLGVVGESLANEYDRPIGIGIGGDGRILVGINGQVSAEPNIFGAMRFYGDTVAPYGAKVTNLPAVATAKTRTVTWTASDDNTGVSKFDVRYRSARYDASSLGSATTLKSATTAPYGGVSWATGRTYCYEVRGRDGAGNVGLYGTQSCVVVPLDDRSMTRSGSWSSVSSSKYYLGTASRSTDSGATLKRTGAKYRSLALVATTCSTCGTAKVYLGSTLLKTVSLKSSTTKRKVIIPIDVSASVRSGTITVKQASGGKAVIIEGLAIGLY
jgi:uncharacterized delta-60 repeat protein